MFSVGAFLFPILLTLFTATGESGWITACYFMLAMGILSWILYAMIPMETAVFFGLGKQTVFSKLHFDGSIG